MKLEQNKHRPFSFRWFKRQGPFLAFALAAFVGLVVRGRQYATGRSLWLDESAVTLNIIQRSYAELLQPLDYAQGAPIGFLWIQKAIAQAIGVGEYAIRFYPFLSGLVSLLIFPLIARKYLSKRGAFLALLLFAVSQYMIYFSSEAKQYASDVLMTLLGLVIFLHLMEKKLTRASAVGLALSGGILISLSHPAVFVLTSVGMIAFHSFYRRQSRDDLKYLLLITLWWGVSFVILYFVSLSHLLRNEGLLSFWQNALPPPLDEPLQAWNWFTGSVHLLFINPGGLTQTWLAIVLTVAGAISLGFRDRNRLASLLLPLIFTLGAAALHKYPFGDRMLLFLIPLVFILIAEGLDRLLTFLQPFSLSILGYAAVLLLLFQPSVRMIDNFINPQLGEDVAPMIRYARTNWQEGDILYVYYGTFGPFHYYLSQHNFREGDYVLGVQSRDDWSGYLPQLKQLISSHRRVWFLFSHVHANDA